ncbi:PEP-CTERM sorting domain-containing protein [Methylophilus sp.]|jgi:hypothetical protein|uniref:PEP-CTERM sorting domain-containing protein n=1 Tax=Methylophilus sp. TaxID=29541 RepID=UPI0025DC199E|nr:PEP-CTERM sorting domain-containing protein [Methylophilus sp.]
MLKLSTVTLCSTVAVTLLSAANAQAAPLPEPVITQVINIVNQTASHQAGTLTKSTSTTDGQTSVTLGDKPTVFASMTDTNGGSGGSVYARLLYNVEYVNPGVFTNFDVTVNTSNRASVGGYGVGGVSDLVSTATSFLSVSGNGKSNNFSNCITSGGHCGDSSLQLPPFTFSMRQNTVYTVDMYVSAQAYGGANVNMATTSYAWISLETQLLAMGAPAGGYFKFSPDISAALIQTPVPEPDAYALMMLGLGLMGLVAKRRASQHPA